MISNIFLSVGNRNSKSLFTEKFKKSEKRNHYEIDLFAKKLILRNHDGVCCDVISYNLRLFKRVVYGEICFLNI